MEVLKRVWNTITYTKALEKSSGEFETLFFESVYRVTYIGGWSVSDHGVWYRIYSGIIKLSISLLVCCEIWSLLTESKNLDNIIDNINVTLMHLISLYRYKNLIENKDIYRQLATAMESLYFNTNTKKRMELVKFWSQRNERFLKLLLCLGSGTLSAWYILLYDLHRIRLKMWHIYPLVDDVEYNLMVAARFPFSYQSSLRYPIFYVFIFFIFNYASLFVMINDLIMQAHLLHLLCQYTVLKDCFENIIEDCKNNDNQQGHLIIDALFKKKYKECLNGLVEQHKFILRNTLHLKNTLSAPMLGQLTASTILICSVSFQATTNIGVSVVKFFMALLYLMYNMFELFIFCKWCDEIKIQSQSIAQAIYYSGWEKGIMAIPGVRATILLVMSRAQKPLVLTAGGLFELSLASYTTLVKTSYSALTVLRRFQQ